MVDHYSSDLADPVQYDYDDYGDGPLDYDNDYGALAYHDGNTAELIEYRLHNYELKNELYHICSNCIGNVFWQALNQSKVMFIACLFLRIISFTLNHFLFHNPKNRFCLHIITSIMGAVVLHDIFTEIFFPTLYVVAILILITFISNWICSRYLQRRGGITTTLITVSYIIFSEIFFSDPSMWHRIRGLLLLMAMKIISLSIDYDMQKVSCGLPNFFEYLSYCLHPGTLVFGPWISLQEFRDSLFSKRPVNFEWLYCIVKSCVQCTICLLLSVCIFPYLFIDGDEIHSPVIFPVVGSDWLLSYKNAISFHFSHYYVGYLSTALSLLSGVGAVKVPHKKVKTDDDSIDTACTKLQPSYTWSKHVITKPLSIEFPRSMLNVVVAWNIPMSKWLKNYVFDTSRFLGAFPAIIFTYAASAMLHGLSFHLAAVLFSLGFYTYTEHSLRLKLSKIFQCHSIQARPKPQSTDTTKVPFWARVFNLVWIFINIMHLAYLGSMFHSEDDEMQSEGYSLSYTIGKWSQLSFVSHWFALVCFVFNCLI